MSETFEFRGKLSPHRVGVNHRDRARKLDARRREEARELPKRNQLMLQGRLVCDRSERDLGKSTDHALSCDLCGCRDTSACLPDDRLDARITKEARSRCGCALFRIPRSHRRRLSIGIDNVLGREPTRPFGQR
ncbi:hypothetical protein T281_13650 [Rhodomicrobium udaipurense JA643]|nr:hypothetical protein T281_13650 [Rhodomicrobium udaipurense JA643]